MTRVYQSGTSLQLRCFLGACLARAAAALAVHDGSAGAPRRDAWPTDVVVVVTAFNEYVPAALPAWMRDDSELSFYVYQRVNETGPNYSPNFGQEGGMIVQFIRDHYANLPAHTAFLQADNLRDVSPEWRTWLRCLRVGPDARGALYAPLAPRLVHNRTLGSRRPEHAALQEACLRNLLRAFAAASSLPPRTPPTATFHCCSHFVAARRALLAHPLRAYQAAYSLLVEQPDGKPGACGLDRGAIAWDELHFASEGSGCSSDECRATANAWRRKPHTPRFEQRDGHLRRIDDAHPNRMGALAFEVAQHAIFGGKPIVWTTHGWCDAFTARSQCKGSPCKK